jgi:dTDP-4-amino-4,6-dideoxygalactose transaminase
MMSKDPENIPLVDLAAAHRAIADEVQRGFARVFEGTAFILGEDVAAFEREFAAFVGAGHCVGVASGTDALELALRAIGVGVGDEVIVPANSFIASAHAVVRTGASPVLVDVDPVHHLIDPAAALARVGPRTKAILPVHLYGQLAPMEALAAAGVPIVEDAAQSHGATRHGRGMGTFGVVAGTSFYPGKNLGAYGDAGAVVTNSPEIARTVGALRNHGSDRKYHHPETGFNSRLDTLQAVVLRAKLARLADGNVARRRAAAHYDALLADLPAITRPATLAGNEHVWHLYVIRVPERDRVVAHLNANGIGAGIHYPVPIHRQGAFAHLGHRPGAFPVTEQAAEQILSLPLFPEITPSQQERIVAKLAEANKR